MPRRMSIGYGGQGAIGLFQKVYSAGLWGITGFLVSVEADVHDGLPGFQMTGNLSQETREGQERVRTALKNAGFRLPAKKIVVNLSPADVRKEGTAYDLAVGAAVLGAFGLLDADGLRDALILGELGLDGTVKPVRGILPIVSLAREKGICRCLLPENNVREGGLVDGMQIVPVSNIRQLADMLGCARFSGADPFASSVPLRRGASGGRTDERVAVPLQESEWEETEQTPEYAVDFSDLNGQKLLRRATEIAVAGRHNILYIGPAGSGKTMAAMRIPTIMPPLGREESLEISKIYSICGLLPAASPLIRERPFRSPHHTITPAALAGGGASPRPGEISLASGGVLFLDELPEFSVKAIEVLRQPLEDRKVRISRLHRICTFPADTVLAAACNPCPCGFYPDRSRCRCSEWQVRRYLGRISKPILDRIDITVEASPVSYEELRQKGDNESSAQIRSRVVRVLDLQARRFAGREKIRFNGEMSAKEIEEFCPLDQEGEDYLREIYEKLHLSARGCHKLLKVARTIADLDGEEQIGRIHLCEAAGYRSLESKYWKE